MNGVELQKKKNSKCMASYSTLIPCVCKFVRDHAQGSFGNAQGSFGNAHGSFSNIKVSVVKLEVKELFWEF